MSKRDATIYYDNDCGFCRRMTRVALHIDNHQGRRLLPKALQHPESEADLFPLSAEQRFASWHLITSDGTVYSGGAAFAALARIWGHTGPLTRAIESNARAVERCYGWVASNRVLFGRLTRWMPDLPDTAKENPPA